MQPSYNIKKITTVLALISIFFIIVGCDTLKYKRADVKDNPVNVKERARKNVAEGKGFSLGNIGNSGNGNFDFASSNPLWRASLEILDFTPLSNVDYSGGIIITDWFDNENDKNSNLKISIKFLSNEIRADGLNVQIYEKICKDDNCTTRKLENNVSNEIKATILRKASLIVKKQRGKKAKDYFKKNPIDPADAMKD